MGLASTAARYLAWITREVTFANHKRHTICIIEIATRRVIDHDASECSDRRGRRQR